MGRKYCYFWNIIYIIWSNYSVQISIIDPWPQGVLVHLVKVLRNDDWKDSQSEHRTLIFNRTLGEVPLCFPFRRRVIRLPRFPRYLLYPTLGQSRPLMTGQPEWSCASNQIIVDIPVEVNTCTTIFEYITVNGIMGKRRPSNITSKYPINQ